MVKVPFAVAITCPDSRVRAASVAIWRGEMDHCLLRYNDLYPQMPQVTCLFPIHFQGILMGSFACRLMIFV